MTILRKPKNNWETKACIRLTLKKNFCELVDKSNSSFREFKRIGCISNITLKYFTYEFKKATNLGKFYLLPKIHNTFFLKYNVMAEVNLFSDDIKFTYEYNKDTISFLDLKVILSDGKLITSL